MKTAPIKILLVEDSLSDAFLLGELLKKVTEFDFNMIHSTDLSAGFNELVSNDFDAIILDLELPDSFGISTYEKMREKAENTPIIIASGNDDRELMALALNHGADNYLIKDAFDGNRIAIAVLSSIRNRNQNRKIS
ncbi:MAG: response regulator [Candidatus Obscuribacterales bacterium]|nr:response regulator [Candidatus Obscuribacterales bacterium]